jgi:osmoprotectant transport system permease protein
VASPIIGPVAALAQSDLGPKTFDPEWIADNFSDDILPALIGHLYLCGVSIGIALVISIPIGILVARYRKAYAPVAFAAGFLYSIPSLAFFVVLASIPAIGIGATPVIIALVAYSLLVMIRNTVTGLDSVPEETKDAARGMGMTNRQILWRVELPLALPVIVAGIRIATVTVIGIATIGAFVSAGGLGALIFEGIRRVPTAAIVGAFLATALAVFADVALLRLERLLTPWSRRAQNRRPTGQTETAGV